MTPQTKNTSNLDDPKRFQSYLWNISIGTSFCEINCRSSPNARLIFDRLTNNFHACRVFIYLPFWTLNNVFFSCQHDCRFIPYITVSAKNPDTSLSPYKPPFLWWCQLNMTINCYNLGPRKHHAKIKHQNLRCNFPKFQKHQYATRGSPFMPSVQLGRGLDTA